MVTGHGDVAMAVRCLKAGAFDFVEKPFDDDVLVAHVERAAEQSALRGEAGELRRQLSLLAPCEDGCYGMIGASRAMQEVYAQVEAAAGSTVPVAIVGETGSGKELVARAIHAQSARSAGPFVPVNAGALPEGMLESELFGHAKGSFTGALADREGRLVSASGGTLLLDEIETHLGAGPGAAAARARRRRRGAARLGPRPEGGRAPDHLVERRPRGRGPARGHAGGLLPPHHGAAHPRAGAARAARGHFPARGALPAPRRRAGRDPGADHPVTDAGRHARPRLARQRAGAEERRGAHGHHRAGRGGGSVRARPASRGRAAPHASRGQPGACGASWSAWSARRSPRRCGSTAA